MADAERKQTVEEKRQEAEMESRDRKITREKYRELDDKITRAYRISRVRRGLQRAVTPRWPARAVKRDEILQVGEGGGTVDYVGRANKLLGQGELARKIPLRFSTLTRPLLQSFTPARQTRMQRLSMAWPT